MTDDEMWDRIERRRKERQTHDKNTSIATWEPSTTRGEPRPGSYVAAAPIVPARRQPIIEVLPPAEHEQSLLRNAPTGGTIAQAQIRGSYRDRAEGFQVASFPLAMGAGLFAVILAIVGFGRPFGLGLLMWFGVAFMLTWLGAWVVHNAVSAEGIALVRELSLWAYLKREQRERWDWQWTQIDDERDGQ